jgi:flagellar biosynthesis/type III secretory pathway ATPase
MPHVTDAAHRRGAEAVRRLVAAYEEKRDLISLGAYREGADPALDRAVRAEPEIRRLLVQAPEELAAFEETLGLVERIAARHGA